LTPLLFVSGEYPPDVGGVGDYTAHLRTSLQAFEGRESSVLTRRHVRHWDARALVWLLRTAPRQGIVHIQFQAGAFDLLGDVCLMPSLLRRTRPRVKVVTTFHDVRVPYLFPRAGSVRRAAVQLLARTSHAVIAADERDLHWLRTARQKEQIPIGPNIACQPGQGYDRHAFRAALGLEADTLAIVYFGLLNQSKGLDLLLEAFERISKQRPGARLLLLGGETGASDPTDRLTAARLAGRLDRLAGNVVRTGWLPPEALSAHLLAGDVALLPYVDGASPRRGSLLACAEHGLPIVSTEPVSRAVADAVQPVPADAGSLATAALEVASDPALTSRLRTASRALAARTSWPAIAAAHARLYEALPRLYS